MSEINNIIILLSIVHLIVNNVVTDGAIENTAVMRAMDIHTVREDLGKNGFFTKNQTMYLDLEKKIVFLLPKRSDTFIFIGGDIPHIVKRMFNTLERSSKANIEIRLVYNGED